MVRTLTAVKKLQKQFPDIDGIRLGNALGYGDDCIFLGDCAEGGTIDGTSACNYFGYEEDRHERIWVMGVHRQLRDALEELGFYAECYDPGTYIAYKN